MIPQRIAGCFGLSFTSVQILKVSSVTGMLTRQIRRLSFEAPRCGWPKRGLSTAPCAKLME